MKKWFIHLCLLLSGLLLTQSALSKDFDSKNPYTLIESVSTDTFGRLKANIDVYKKDPEQLRTVVKEDLMPYINVRYAALKVLGPLARKASKEDRDLFTKAFYDYLVKSYAQIFLQYTDQKIEIEKGKEIASNRKTVSVRVDIIDKSRPPIHLDFKLRKNNKTLDWQVFDIQVEGVSMLDTKANEWRPLLRKDGIVKVAQQLLENTKKPLKAEGATS